MPKIAEIEWTPNPNAKRFVLKEALTQGVSRSYDGPTLAQADPLARQLFAIPHVTNVFYVDKYLTVTQDGAADWRELERLLAVPIREADATQLGQAQQAAKADLSGLSDDDRARLDKIDALLEERVRPALMMDGGGLEIMSWNGATSTLAIHYQGACGSCPSSISGTLMGIEGLLQSIEPRIQVVAV